MTEQANRIDWLERQLAQVRGLLKAERSLLAEQPEDFSIKLSISSLESREDEILHDLQLEKSLFQKEVVELRLIGKRMDGSIPLKLLSAISGKVNEVLALTAYHLRHGESPTRGVPQSMMDEMDLRLSGLTFGSTRLVIAGNVTPDTTGDAAMESALEQIFAILLTNNSEELTGLAAAIGLPATRALGALLDELERRSIGAELTWPATNNRLFKWGGSLDDVRYAREKLNSAKLITPKPTEITGRIISLSESGSVYVRDSQNTKKKIEYSKQQYQHVKNWTLGMEISVHVMQYTTVDVVTDVESSRYKLITE